MNTHTLYPPDAADLAAWDQQAAARLLDRGAILYDERWPARVRVLVREVERLRDVEHERDKLEEERDDLAGEKAGLEEQVEDLKGDLEEASRDADQAERDRDHWQAKHEAAEARLVELEARLGDQP